jgi:hypothetical protein
MIAVLMRQNHAAQTGYVFADECEPSGNLARAQACINQHARFARDNQNRIAG